MIDDDMPAHYAAARIQGSRFYKGAECNTHPGQPRYTANKRCVACAKGERLARAQANPMAERARKARARATALQQDANDSPMAALLRAALQPMAEPSSIAWPHISLPAYSTRS